MRLLFSNKFFFFTSCSSFFNQFGSAIYNLVFVIYVANVYQSPLLVGLANVTMVVPYIFQIWIAKKADEVRQRRKQLLWMPIFQVICFLAELCSVCKLRWYLLWRFAYSTFCRIV